MIVDAKPGRHARRAIVGALAVFLPVVGVSAQLSWLANLPQVYVRWSETTSPGQRVELEREFHLSAPTPHEESPLTWKYRLRDFSRANLRRLVDHPTVSDTDRIDRARAELTHPPVHALVYLLRASPLGVLFGLLAAALLIYRPHARDTPAVASPNLEWAAIAYIWLTIVVATFGYHWATHNSLTNDHSGYLVMARQIVLGELPIRDFIEHGTLLHILISAALQWMFGHQLLAEMIVCTGFIAAGYGITFVLASRLSRSTIIGFALTVCAVLTAPRPYSYPKIVIYPAAIWLIWRYVSDPSTRRMALMSLGAAVALLLRVDHGVVVLSVAAIVVLLRENVVLSRKSGIAVARFIGMTMGWLLPFFVYLMFSGGILRHFLTVVEFGARALGESDPLQFDLRHLSAAAPPIEVAIASIHDLFLVVTMVAVIGVSASVALDLHRQRRVSERTLRALTVVLMWLVAAPMLARDNFYARLGDVAPVVLLLVAWLSRGLWPNMPRAVAGAALDTTRVRAFVVVRQVIAATLLAGVIGSIVQAKGGPVGTYGALRQGVQDLGARARTFNVTPGFRSVRDYSAVTEYAYRCTEPSDRLLVTWYAPEIYYGANRRFAGNQWVYVEGFLDSPAEQAEVVRRLQAESVPLIFSKDDENSSWKAAHPLLAEYFDQQFVEVGTLDGVTIFTDRGRPVARRLAVTQLPCFVGDSDSEL